MISPKKNHANNVDEIGANINVTEEKVAVKCANPQIIRLCPIACVITPSANIKHQSFMLCGRIDRSKINVIMRSKGQAMGTVHTFIVILL